MEAGGCILPREFAPTQLQKKPNTKNKSKQNKNITTKHTHTKTHKNKKTKEKTKKTNTQKQTTRNTDTKQNKHNKKNRQHPKNVFLTKRNQNWAPGVSPSDPADSGDFFSRFIVPNYEVLGPVVAKILFKTD